MAIAVREHRSRIGIRIGALHQNRFVDAYYLDQRLQIMWRKKKLKF